MSMASLWTIWVLHLRSHESWNRRCRLPCLVTPGLLPIHRKYTALICEYQLLHLCFVLKVAAFWLWCCVISFVLSVLFCANWEELLCLIEIRGVLPVWSCRGCSIVGTEMDDLHSFQKRLRSKVKPLVVTGNVFKRRKHGHRLMEFVTSRPMNECFLLFKTRNKIRE